MQGCDPFQIHPLHSDPSLLGCIRKITQVTLIIPGRIQLRLKECLLYKCFQLYEHVPKGEERHHLSFRSLKTLGTGVFCIPEKLCAKKMH